MPKVSVVIPTYNCTKYLSEAIDSVLNQTYQDFEIIVVDDGSTDDTKIVIQSYIAKYGHKIRYLFQSNQGPSVARNRGIENSKSEYIAFLDSDDLYSTNFIDESLSCLQKYDFDFVIPQKYYLKKIKSDGNFDLILCDRDNLPNDPKALYKELFPFFIGCIKMLTKKKCFEESGLFDENLFIHEDWDIWVRFALSGFKAGLVISNAPLWFRIIREDSLWHSPSNKQKRLINYFYALEKHRINAFAIDRDLKKIYAKKYWEIGTGLLKLDIHKINALKILLRSQIYEFNIQRIVNSITT